MTSLVGNAAILAALGFALYAAIALLAGARRGSLPLIESAARAVVAHFVLVTLAFLALEYALVTSDFSLKYVALNSSRAYALWYRMAGLWAALEGSLVLWEWIQAGLAVVIVLRYRRREPELFPVAQSVLMAVSAFFLVILAFAANPFTPMTPVPADGRGMNPLLEDTSMLVHPLLLYAGWTGFTVPYAFAMAALVTGQLSDRWVVATRRWAVGAWFFMTAGIVYGGWWSYHVLGWGGYWAWDPVENASFLPWLTATAYIHSIMVQERRRMLRVWNLVLLILTYSLIVFGTFLTRSGVIASVHSFTQSPVGYFFLVYLALVLFFSLGWVAARAYRLRDQPQFDELVSRESAFLLNNVAFVGICFTVFFGTIFPLLAEAVRGVKMSVGAPYFNQVMVPFGLGLLLLMGMGPMIPWRRAEWAALGGRLLAPVSAAVMIGLILAGFGVRQLAPLLGFTAAAFVAACVVAEFVRGVRLRGRLAGEGPLGAAVSLFRMNRRRYGGYLVHFGVAVLTVGLIASSSYQQMRESQLQRGESLEIGRYRLAYDAVSAVDGPTHVKVLAQFTVFQGDRVVGRMEPALRFYPTEQSPIAEVDYWVGFREDLYLILGSFDRNGAWVTVKAQVTPVISWLWIGGVIMALGTALALIPESWVGQPTRSVREVTVG